MAIQSQDAWLDAHFAGSALVGWIRAWLVGGAETTVKVRIGGRVGVGVVYGFE